MIKNLRDSHLHLSGAGALALLGIITFVCGVRPVLVASRALDDQAVESARLLEQSPELSEANRKMQKEIQEQIAAQDARYCLALEDSESTLDLVSDLLDQREVELVNFRESLVEKTIRVELQVKGDYGKVVHLLGDLRILKRPVRITSFHLNPIEESGKQVVARLKVDLPETPVLLRDSTRDKLVKMDFEANEAIQ